jgi:hypothetical protein
MLLRNAAHRLTGSELLGVFRIERSAVRSEMFYQTRQARFPAGVMSTSFRPRRESARTSAHPSGAAVMNNLSSHKVAVVHQMIEKAGVKLLYLPFYSHELNLRRLPQAQAAQIP